MNGANNGLRRRIGQFFEDNPSEWLTKEDMTVKFDCPEKSLDQALCALKAEGALVRSVIFRATPRRNAT